VHFCLHLGSPRPRPAERKTPPRFIGKHARGQRRAVLSDPPPTPPPPVPLESSDAGRGDKEGDIYLGLMKRNGKSCSLVFDRGRIRGKMRMVPPRPRRPPARRKQNRPPPGYILSSSCDIIRSHSYCLPRRACLAQGQNIQPNTALARKWAKQPLEAFL